MDVLEKAGLLLAGTRRDLLANALVLVVAKDDAAAIYVNDQKSNLLAQARVVFILK